MPPDLTLWLTLISSNYPCLKHIFVVPKVFEPLKFYCIWWAFNTHSPYSLKASGNLYTLDLQWLEHWWLVYHGCFEIILESLGKNTIAANLEKLRVIFYVENGILCVLIRIASVRRFQWEQHNIPSCYRKSKKYPYYATWSGAMPNSY